MSDKLLTIGGVILLLLFLLVTMYVLYFREGGDSNEFEEPTYEGSTVPDEASTGEVGIEETQGSSWRGEESPRQEKTLIDTGGISLYND